MIQSWKSQFLSGLMQPLSNFVGNLGYVSVCLLGGFLAGLALFSAFQFKHLVCN